MQKRWLKGRERTGSCSHMAWNTPIPNVVNNIFYQTFPIYIYLHHSHRRTVLGLSPPTNTHINISCIFNSGALVHNFPQETWTNSGSRAQEAPALQKFNSLQDLTHVTPPSSLCHETKGICSLQIPLTKLFANLGRAGFIHHKLSLNPAPQRAEKPIREPKSYRLG